MPRVTKKDLEQAITVIQNRTGQPYFIEFAYGKPRLLLKKGKGASNISPRLSSSDLYVWMEAFLEGFEQGTGGDVDIEDIRGVINWLRDKSHYPDFEMPKYQMRALANDLAKAIGDSH